MKLYKTDSVDYYVSDDVVSTSFEKQDLEEEIARIIRLYSGRVGDFFELYSKKFELPRSIILHAHGKAINNEWYFGNEEYPVGDTDKPRPVQDWINENDGLYAVMFILCCNPENLEIYSEKSVIIHPNRIVNEKNIIQKYPLKIFVPSHGYIGPRSNAFKELHEFLKD